MKFEQTLQNDRLFLSFAVTLMTISKSNRLLQESGADPEAIQHINAAIELIAKQLDQTAKRLETEILALKNVDDLLLKLGIPQKNCKEDGSGKKQ